MTVQVPSKQTIEMTRAELIAFLSEQIAALEATGLSRRQARRAVASSRTGLSNLTLARLVDVEHQV